MRKPNPLDPLVTRVVQSILVATLMQPERRWYLSDLARFLDRTPSSLQSALTGLARAGVLKRESEGNRVYYQADRRCPYFGELHGIIVKTVGLVDVLRDALRPQASRIQAAFVFGSVARATEQSSSDVDLGIIGRLGRFDLALELDEAEKRIGRPINTKLWSPRAFEKKKRSGDHFVAALVRGEKLMVIGDVQQVERTRCRGTDRAARDESARAR
jgi:predicted nucleotidyltransferase